MARFARGTLSVAICDRCGMKVRYLDLRPQIFDGAMTGLMVCPDCLDEDHPQLKVGRNFKPEPQALEHPRPEVTLEPGD